MRDTTRDLKIETRNPKTESRIPKPDLRRTLSSFEIGESNRDGYSAPKRRLEVWDPLTHSPCTLHPAPCTLNPEP